MEKKVKDFYDHLSEKYTQLILRCVPRYNEMQLQLFNYIPQENIVNDILELGCGSGILSAKILKRFPEGKLHLVDISDQILIECKNKLGDPDNCTFINQDFIELEFEESSFDFITSCIAIHHLHNEEKKKLFEKINKWLRPGGIFIYSDQTRGTTEEIYKKHIEIWEDESRKMGANDAEWDEWMAHQQQHDYHASIMDQISWLKESGFQDVDVLWRYLLWTVYYTRK